MSVLHTPFNHVPNNDLSLFRNRVDYTCTFSPQITPLHLSKEPIPKLTFASSSSSSSVPPIVVEQELTEEDRVFHEKEKTRRLKIGLANKGKVAWNKGRKHTAETRELIKIRTLEAMRDPKVKSSQEDAVSYPFS
ncbi:hypothetical protein RYX36_035262 [Vicia faba]